MGTRQPHCRPAAQALARMAFLQPPSTKAAHTPHAAPSRVSCMQPAAIACDICRFCHTRGAVLSTWNGRAVGQPFVNRGFVFAESQTQHPLHITNRFISDYIKTAKMVVSQLAYNWHLYDGSAAPLFREFVDRPRMPI